VNDDDKWRQILRGLNKEFYHQTVTTSQIENNIMNFITFIPNIVTAPQTICSILQAYILTKSI